MAARAAVGDELAGIGDDVAAYALSNPVVAGAVVVLAAAVLVALWLAYRWLRRTRADRLVGALRARDRVAVVMHPNPDPDAMAAALAVGHVAAAVGTDATLAFPGQIRHQENRVFQNVLELDLERVDSAADLDDDVVLVDHNEARGFEGAGDLRPYAVIDHHPGSGEGRAFTDVRPDYGATSTVLAEYLYDLGFAADPEADRELTATLATALLYGILSDTDGLTWGYAPADYAAGAYLCDTADTDRLERIANPEVDAEVLDVRARAIVNRETDGPYVVSDVGEVNNVDAIAQAADELIRLEGTTAAVVYGARDGRLHLSGRSRDDRVHMGRALREAVAEVPMAQAGGHKRMGGCQLPIEHMAGIGPAGGLTREELPRRLFDAMTGDV